MSVYFRLCNKGVTNRLESIVGKTLGNLRRTPIHLPRQVKLNPEHQTNKIDVSEVDE